MPDENDRQSGNIYLACVRDCRKDEWDVIFALKKLQSALEDKTCSSNWSHHILKNTMIYFFLNELNSCKEGIDMFCLPNMCNGHILSHLIFIAVLWSRYNSSHFVSKETKAYRQDDLDKVI